MAAAPPRSCRLTAASWRAWPLVLAGVVAPALAGCDDDTAAVTTATQLDAGRIDAGPTTAPAIPARPEAIASDPNPLGLPPRRIRLDPGRRVFTFSDRMLAGAKPGSTLILYAATVSALDGDDLIIEGRAGPPYKVHAGYVIPVPDAPGIRPGDPVITEWNGVMKHGVITKLPKDRVAVRFTDMDARSPEGVLKNPRLIKQTDGLVAGNYAALEDGDELRHVLLVSPVIQSESKQWFALGFGGAAMVVDEARLRPIPVKWSPRAGAPVSAEWVGTMRRASVISVGDTGLFTVRFERAGPPTVVGWGLLMKPHDAPAAGR